MPIAKSRQRKMPGKVAAGLRRILAQVRSLKAEARGRVWDELHLAESRLTRAGEGRRSTFKHSAKKKKGGTKKG